MSESKHTPGKLMMSSSFLLVTNEAVVVANTQPIDVGGITTTYDEGEANAERLIKCWNSHDALVAACKNMIKQVIKYTPQLDREKRWEIIQARKAIAEAEKGD